ncbi:hypothetical protein NIES4101_25550 (plasmid) [Calothrix sp. NIES-4101]|nr:hypothetical protein NIES4101_25550 [Calothrix sp. NIES-4101]
MLPTVKQQILSKRKDILKKIPEIIGWPPRYVQNGTRCKVLLRSKQKTCDLQGFQALKQALNFEPHPTTVAHSPYQSGNHQTA